MLPADLVPGPGQGYWSYQEYAALTDEKQSYEIMDGVLLMPPSPNPVHQSITGKIYLYLTQHVETAGSGRVYMAPLDVELSPKRVFQPNVFVLFNESLGKITASHIVGAPDLVVEVTSPGTAAYDRLSKWKAYAEAGVREYWIVNSLMQSIEILSLKSQDYESQGIFRGKDAVLSPLIPGIRTVRVEQFFV
ncbi:MAG: Uma2 family endonuclease [Ktedonobacteraceae bacterium]|nr:Uma2 family endonuclease [Ktedonobacteraceae bacterium]